MNGPRPIRSARLDTEGYNVFMVRSRLIYILLIMVSVTLGYLWGKNDTYKQPITIPIFNKYYLPGEPVEYKDGRPINEFSTVLCYIDHNNIRKSKRPELSQCSEIIQDNYGYLEKEILSKLAK